MSGNGIRLNSVRAYERLELIHEGTYGRVYRARQIETGKVVALKRIKMLPEVLARATHMRELAVLGALKHRNVVRLYDVVYGSSDAKIYAVMEYVPSDLHELGRVSLARARDLSAQLLTALDYIHSQRVMHRDVSSSNILVDADHVLKVADFGLARFTDGLDGNATLTPSVVTLRYRAPELLLGSTTYTSAIDVWSAACVMFEMFTGEPLFEGESELVHLAQIFQTLGPPNDANPWTSLRLLPDGGTIQVPEEDSCSTPSASSMFSRVSAALQNDQLQGTLAESCTHFLLSMLQYEPSRRATPKQALEHAFLRGSDVTHRTAITRIQSEE
ncbi:Cyclin-dependent kinase 2 [Porphyridium purpureum]|uniref:Cyclin-dependent kinase 2 n=1 Tax=Porphyridium purpureum TaxID=35688 RepID=A0A5J4Z3L1_PORPP|nr:Cyclin-dependent kinase 2 [Porphyridium purpureum]|eukprot:POR5359..scf295_1